MGAPEEVIKEQERAADFVVLSSNWEAVIAFHKLQTQWNKDMGLNGIVYWGLKYEAVLPVLQGLYPDNWQTLFEDIQQIEIGALPELNSGK